MTLREEVASLYDRPNDPDRPCDECGLPLADWKRGCLISIKLSFGYLIYSICDQCGKVRPEHKEGGQAPRRAPHI
jgi:hypothetical protein